jgi:hypothetical protein
LVIAALLAVVGQAAFQGQQADAFPAFKRRFDARYLAKGTPLYAAYGGRSSCNVCHLGGAMDRERRNEYGQALDKLLNRADAEALSIESSRRDPEAARTALRRIDAALAAVEKGSADPRSQAPTFGQLIREGKLPISPMALPDAPSAR